MTEKRPNFFAVGAPKCATSSLYHYVKQHPDIFVPDIKELHYFSYPEVSETYYSVQFITNESEYLQQYTGMQQEQASGDLSPSYLFTPAAAQRIKSFDPRARIIILLRNPIERAISHYLMDVRLGIQVEALSTYLQKTEANRLFFKEYIEVGRYYEQVGNYLETFGCSQVLIILYDDLCEYPAKCVERIYRFLRVEPSFRPNVNIKKNVYRIPRNTILANVLNNQRIKNFAQKSLPEAIRFRLKEMLTVNDKPIFGDERKQLRDIYEEDICKLARLIDRDLSRWLASRP